ncbi:hypothetical protein [Streptomyces sp. WAC06614]|uniref:hypothetical protein n=1 Tax=Streptomyces sp. WAC06614 TaxID=2487416 RepID=UPI000F7744A0|nr:hypothetical protein [Streptomyces sp. WAC06614]RSS80785.1 hypothetical protein EF918_12460 [Streptomyces sp. WAC06614]
MQLLESFDVPEVLRGTEWNPWFTRKNHEILAGLTPLQLAPEYFGREAGEPVVNAFRFSCHAYLHQQTGVPATPDIEDRLFFGPLTGWTEENPNDRSVAQTMKVDEDQFTRLYQQFVDAFGRHAEGLGDASPLFGAQLRLTSFDIPPILHATSWDERFTVENHMVVSSMDLSALASGRLDATTGTDGPEIATAFRLYCREYFREAAGRSRLDPRIEEALLCDELGGFPIPAAAAVGVTDEFFEGLYGLFSDAFGRRANALLYDRHGGAEAFAAARSERAQQEWPRRQARADEARRKAAAEADAAARARTAEAEAERVRRAAAERERARTVEALRAAGAPALERARNRESPKERQDREEQEARARAAAVTRAEEDRAAMWKARKAEGQKRLEQIRAARAAEESKADRAREEKQRREAADRALAKAQIEAERAARLAAEETRRAEEAAKARAAQEALRAAEQAVKAEEERERRVARRAAHEVKQRERTARREAAVREAGAAHEDAPSVELLDMEQKARRLRSKVRSLRESGTDQAELQEREQELAVTVRRVKALRRRLGPGPDIAPAGTEHLGSVDTDQLRDELGYEPPEPYSEDIYTFRYNQAIYDYHAIRKERPDVRSLREVLDLVMHRLSIANEPLAQRIRQDLKTYVQDRVRRQGQAAGGNARSGGTGTGAGTGRSGSGR